MKKTYIQPIVEISKGVLKTSILGISMDNDGTPDPNTGEGGDDDGSHTPDANRFNLWDDI